MKKFHFIAFMMFFLTCVLSAVDWVQFQFNAARTGNTTDSVAPRFRPRWVWFGTSNVVRNHLSNASWTGPDMPAGVIIGNVYTLPTSVPFTFSDLAQPIVASGNIYIGDMDGNAYCIRLDDGTTLWTAQIQGGTLASAVYVNSIVVWGTLSGKIYGFNATNGSPLWTVTTDGPIVHAPATNGTVVCVGSGDGKVYCINPSNGNINWTSPYLGDVIAGGIAMDSTSVYVGAENMMFYAINLNDGSIRQSKKVAGQTFHTVWPVVYNNLVFIEAAPIPAIGSEYVGESVMSAATSIDDEQNRWLQWLQGQGGYSDASPDWKHLTVLRTSDFTEPFVVPCAPFEGCGALPEPSVVDNQGRVLKYFKSKWATFARDCGFGTAYEVDISAIDLTTGRRVTINNGSQANNDWYTWETDNLYGLTVGGNYLWLKQTFRGTVCINLTNSSAKLVSVQYSYQDGGNFDNADIKYAGNRDQGARVPSASRRTAGGRIGPAISGSYVINSEPYALACIEHSP